MKATMIFWTWLITLALGFIGGSVLFQSLTVGVIGTSIATIFSLPYLLIMISASFGIKDFWKQQIVHAACTILTSLVLVILDQGLNKELLGLPLGYFVVALIVQYLLYKRLKKPKPNVF